MEPRFQGRTLKYLTLLSTEFKVDPGAFLDFLVKIGVCFPAPLPYTAHMYFLAGS